MLLSNIKNDNTINSFKAPNLIVNKLVSNTLNSIPEAIAICDKNGIILKINSKASRLFGWTDNELIEKKTFDILLTNSYRNNILYQLKNNPSSILDTTHFVYGLKKDGKTFPANLLVSSFSRDFLVEDRKSYLIVFSTSFIISQVKSIEPTKTKFFDGDNYSNLKEIQNLNLKRGDSISSVNLNKPTIHSISELNQVSDRKKNAINNDNEKVIFKQVLEKNSLINTNEKEDDTIIPSFLMNNSSLHEIDNMNYSKNKFENVQSMKKNSNNDKSKGSNFNSIYPNQELMKIEDEEEENENNIILTSKSSTSFSRSINHNESLKGSKPIATAESTSSSILIKKEKIEVIPAYIPSSIQNFSFYTSPLKQIQSIENNKISRMTYSRYQNEFEEISQLGKGGFGSVYQVRNKLDGQLYAIKKIKLQCDPKNTMEYIMNSDFFNAPISQTYLPKNNLSLSIQDTLNSSIDNKNYKKDNNYNYI